MQGRSSAGADLTKAYTPFLSNTSTNTNPGVNARDIAPFDKQENLVRPQPPTFGGTIMQKFGSLFANLNKRQSGVAPAPPSFPNASGAPGAPGETGSLPESREELLGLTPPEDIPGQTNYKDAVKRLENESLFTGKTGRSRAQWNIRQHTNGFGTLALSDTETITRPEADKRFDGDWSQAENLVDHFKFGLPIGVKAALTSLTFNSGAKWMNSGLGAAIEAGDMDTAKRLFTQYNKAYDAKSGQMYELAAL